MRSALTDGGRFGLRLQLKFVPLEEEEEDEDEVAEGIADWSVFGFMFCRIDQPGGELHEREFNSASPRVRLLRMRITCAS